MPSRRWRTNVIKRIEWLDNGNDERCATYRGANLFVRPTGQDCWTWRVEGTTWCSGHEKRRDLAETRAELVAKALTKRLG